MKVALITLHDNSLNYGGMLQNYASMVALGKFGVNVESIYFEAEPHISIKDLIKYVIFHTPYIGTQEKYAKTVKKINFTTFINSNIKWKYEREPSNLVEQYDYFVVGSDQVWNPTWYCHEPLRKDYFLLTFVDKKKRACIAPSFGISELPSEWTDVFYKYLMEFPQLSVRESSGAEIVRNLTGRTAEILIDPTLMLTRDEWGKIEKKPRKINTGAKYALLYFLGSVSNERQRYMEEIIKDNGLTPYILNDVNYVDFYICDPGAFLYLISNAALVLTDSFHACVFSFIYGKPFLVFDREDVEAEMFSRIENFLNMFHLERKYINGGIENQLFECDYNEGKQVLEVERRKAMDFLETSLHLQ